MKPCVIKNIGFENPIILNKYTWAGGSAPLIGNTGGLGSVVVENCWSEGGRSEGVKSVGGLLGILEGNVTVRNCYARSAIQADGDGGGLIGYLVGGKVNNCWAECDANGFSTGGLIGVMYGGDVNDCYAKGIIKGKHESGGFAGTMMSGNIVKCYANCSVVSGVRNTGGFLGQSVGGKRYSCFWNREISPDVNGIGSGNDPNVCGKTTAEMKTTATFAGWDFVSTWAICEGTNYPRLVWVVPGADLVCPDGVSFSDFAVFAREWMKTDCAARMDCEGADFDGSGAVDYDDLVEVAGDWLDGI